MSQKIINTEVEKPKLSATTPWSIITRLPPEEAPEGIEAFVTCTVENPNLCGESLDLGTGHPVRCELLGTSKQGLVCGYEALYQRSQERENGASKG